MFPTRGIPLSPPPPTHTHQWHSPTAPPPNTTHTHSNGIHPPPPPPNTHSNGIPPLTPHSGVPLTPAKTAVIGPDGVCSWQDCVVVDYAESKNQYLIVPDPSQPTQTRWVPRINLYFRAEDPFLFARRFAEAHESCLRAEALLRYSLYVDCMPTDDIAPLASEQVWGAGW